MPALGPGVRPSRAFLFVSAAVLLVQTLGFAQSPQDRRPRFRTQGQGDRSWTIPASTVVSMRMDSWLNSSTSRAGDKFTATVTIPVYVNGKTVIPAGSIVEGHVTAATPAKRRSQSGTIAVEFDQIAFPNGSRLPLRGSLTAADPRDRDRIDDENRVSGQDKNRSTVFIGGGGVIGAVIGGIAGGGKGAAYGGIAGAGVGIAGVLLAKGVEAEVKPGTAFGIQLAEPLTVREGFVAEPSGDTGEDVDVSRPPVTRNDRPAARPDPPAARAEPVLPLSSPEMIRRAQNALKSQGYYEGQADGVVGPRTVSALKTYQREHRLPESGRLDEETARRLGIFGNASPPAPTRASSTTSRPQPSDVDPTPERDSSPDPGTPPPVSTPSRSAPSAAPAASAIKDHLDDLLGEYRQLVNNGASGSGASARYDDSDISCLFALESVSNSATLYASLTSALSDRGNMRTATVAFARDARRADALLATSDSPAARAISAKWDAIRQEVLRLMQSYNIATREIE